MFNGNVLIADKGNVIYRKSFGLAQVKPERALTPESVFELASVSKPFTALAVVLLADQGLLNLDDPLAKHISVLDYYEGVTVRHFLHHTAGLPDYMSVMDKHWHKEGIATNTDMINMLVEKMPKIGFTPGEKYEYSNTGYALLASVIEQVSGMSYGAFLEQYIFKPAGMKNTLVYQSRYAPRVIDNYAYGYVEGEDGELYYLDSLGKTYYTYFLDGIVGDGMVNSTVDDLLAFDRALKGGKFPTAEVFKEGKTAAGKGTKYGFGWALGKDPVYGVVQNHSGGWAGYMTFFERHPEHDKTIILLQNVSWERSSIPIDQVRKILYGQDLPTVDLPLELLKKWEGKYFSEAIGMNLTIFVKDKILMAQADGQSAFPLSVKNEHRFSYAPANITLDFEEGKINFTQSSAKFIFLKK